MRTKLKCDIELQMSTMLKFKYYGHHVMSRKFKYRYIGDINGFGTAEKPLLYSSYFLFWGRSKTIRN